MSLLCPQPTNKRSRTSCSRATPSTPCSCTSRPSGRPTGSSSAGPARSEAAGRRRPSRHAPPSLARRKPGQGLGGGGASSASHAAGVFPRRPPCRRRRRRKVCGGRDAGGRDGRGRCRRGAGRGGEARPRVASPPHPTPPRRGRGVPGRGGLQRVSLTPARAQAGARAELHWEHLEGRGRCEKRSRKVCDVLGRWEPWEEAERWAQSPPGWRGPALPCAHLCHAPISGGSRREPTWVPQRADSSPARLPAVWTPLVTTRPGPGRPGGRTEGSLVLTPAAEPGRTPPRERSGLLEGRLGQTPRPWHPIEQCGPRGAGMGAPFPLPARLSARVSPRVPCRVEG